MIALEAQRQQRVGAELKEKAEKGLENVCVKYIEKVNGIFWEMRDGVLKTGRENVVAEVKMKSEVVLEWQSEAEASLGMRDRARVQMWTVKQYSAALELQIYCADSVL